MISWMDRLIDWSYGDRVAPGQGHATRRVENDDNHAHAESQNHGLHLVIPGLVRQSEKKSYGPAQLSVRRTFLRLGTREVED